MEEKETVQKPEKKGTNKLLLVGGILFLIIVLAGVFFLGYNMLVGEKSDDKITIGPVYQTEEYTVNLLEAGGRRFLRTKFSVEVDNKKVLAEINTKLPMFNDRVISVLGSLTLEDLEIVGAKQKIGSQLANSLNGILNDGEVTNIYFEVFVWQ